MYAMNIFARVASVAFALLALASCGEQEPPVALSPEAELGREIANNNGCASCHGKNGQGVTAPSWQGIYGENVAVEAGGTVLVDDDYLYRSITEPQADIVSGWTIKMPRNKLTDEQIASVITYIKELS